MSVVPPASSPAPFVGLRPFDFHDSGWFFGRERETAALTRKVRTSRFTAVVGPSGSGKSSLVCAGVQPLLAADGWQVVKVRPGSAPIETLASKLAELASQPLAELASQPLAELASQPEDGLARACRFRFDATLRASAYGLAEIAETLAPEAPRLVLVVDQFEELFRYGEDARAAAAAAMREEGRAYVELLLAAAARGAGRLHIVITMRSDYFGNCSAYQGLAEAVSAGQYLVPLPDRDQLETAIRKPVAMAGATVEEGLVQRLLVDVEEETDQLPLFQHTLRRLWDTAQGEPRTLREADYVTVGCVQGSIDQKCEAILARLAKSHRGDVTTLERVMKALTDLDEHDRATRRPQNKSELILLIDDAGDTIAAAASLDRVLQAFAAEDASFVHISDGADPEVDISHEALIRSWKRLAGEALDFRSGWLREEREDGERWREYVRRATEGPLLSVRGQRRLSHWLRRRRLSSAWARRYGNAWDAVGDLRRRSRRATVLQLTASAAVLVAIVAYVLQPDDLRGKVEASLEALDRMSAEELEKNAEPILDRAAEDLLPYPKDHQWLGEMLRLREPKLPRGYGLKEDPSLSASNPPPMFVLTHKPDRRIDGEYFHRIWRKMAQEFATGWGIPAPMAFRFDQDDTLSREEVRITAPSGKSAALLVPRYEERAVIHTHELSESAQQFTEAFSDEWLSIELPGYEDPWLVVPRWSLPIWKAFGASAVLDGSHVTAILLANQLLKAPEVLLTPQVVELLLGRLAKDYPDTVAEARYARGGRLPQDLAEFVKRYRRLTNLPVLLDALAQFPEKGSAEAITLVDKPAASSGSPPARAATPDGWLAEATTSPEVVEQAIEVIEAPQTVLPQQLHGPWANSSGLPDAAIREQDTADPEHDEMDMAFRHVEPWLIFSQPPIRVYLGDGLVNKWKDGDTGLTADLLDGIDAVRDEIFRRTGVEIPGGIRFHPTTELRPWQLAIEAPDRRLVGTATVAQDGPVDGFIEALSADAWEIGAVSLTSEYVSQLLQNVSPELKKWLTDRYSLTDLKLLLRAVVLDSDYAYKAAPERTIRPAEWLLGSLVFWTQHSNSRDTSAMVSRLRQTQSARLNAVAYATSADRSEGIKIGIRALSEGRIEDAEKRFREAGEGEAAAQTFLALYPAAAPESLRRRLEQPCASLDYVDLVRAERIDLEDFIETMPEATLGERWRRPKLCLLASYGPEQQPQRATLLQVMLKEADRPDEWPAEEASYLAHALIGEYDPLDSEEGMVAVAERLLARALRRMDDQQAVDSFYRMVQVCAEDGPREWCWDLADRLARAVPRGDVPLELAYQLSHFEAPRYLQLASMHADQAEENLRLDSDLSAEDRAWRADFLEYSRAMVYNHLAALGDSHHWPTAIKLLETLQDSPAVGSMAQDTLIGLLIGQEKFERASRLIQSAREQWPDDLNFLMGQLWLEIAQGNDKGVAATVEALSTKAGDDKNVLFAASIGELLLLTITHERSRLARKFIAKFEDDDEADYAADYIALLLYGLEDEKHRQEALQVLQSRWSPNVEERWAARLAQGDASVWREMLIAYYLGKNEVVTRANLLALLTDEEKFRARFGNLPLSRQGMLCEFYFYDALLAKTRGDREGMLRGLQATIDSGYRPYNEFKMAKFLREKERAASG